MSLLCSFLPLIFLHRSHDVSLSPSCFFRAAVGLRQLSELRLLLSFLCKRKRTKKIFRGGVPPPQKLPLPRLGQAASRHRLSDASVGHLKCGVRYSLQCSAQIMPEPSGVQTCFFSALAHGDSVCCSHSGEGWLLLPLTSLCAYLSFISSVYSLFRSRDILLPLIVFPCGCLSATAF